MADRTQAAMENPPSLMGVHRFVLHLAIHLLGAFHALPDAYLSLPGTFCRMGSFQVVVNPSDDQVLLPETKTQIGSDDGYYPRDIYYRIYGNLGVFILKHLFQPSYSCGCQPMDLSEHPWGIDTGDADVRW